VEDEKKPCWELVRENNYCLFHICVDCLVYVAKHEDSILTEDEFCFIMEQRKNTIPMESEQKCSQRSFCPVPQLKNTLKRLYPVYHERKAL
jgi:hypothetical protein